MNPLWIGLVFWMNGGRATDHLCVRAVWDPGPAAAKQIQTDDCVARVLELRWPTREQLNSAVQRASGKKLEVTFQRPDGSTHTVSIVPLPKPSLSAGEICHFLEAKAPAVRVLDDRRSSLEDVRLKPTDHSLADFEQRLGLEADTRIEVAWTRDCSTWSSTRSGTYAELKDTALHHGDFIHLEAAPQPRSPSRSP